MRIPPVVKAAAVLLLAAGACLAFGAQNPEFRRVWEGVKEFYASGLHNHRIAGSSLMVMHHNQIMAMEFRGLANIETHQPVERNTIYHWASITKTLTGIAVMQLRDRDLLRLDDPIVKYVPELRDVHDPFGDTSEITIRHLMTRSAGFRAPTWPWGGDKDWQPHEPPFWSQLVAMMPYTEVLSKPGSKYSYSNPGIIFLGRIIEYLSHDDCEVYIDKNVFKPLEMHRSYFDATPYHLLKDRSRSYYLREDKWVPARFDVDTGITVSNGGLNAPFDDMAKYLNFLVRDPSRQGIHDQVLKRASLEEMFQPQVEIERRGNESDSIGLIFFVEEHAGKRFVAHSGSQNGFVSHFYIHQPSRTAYLVAFDTDAGSPGKDQPPSTRMLDRELSDYLFKNVFPTF